MFTGRQVVSHVEITRCAAGSALERFQWSVVGGEAKLQDYELRQILERGKIYVFGNSNIGIAPK
jgi:hypothetical protein